MKPILSSLKEKKRYIVFEIISDKKFSKDMVENSMYENALNFLGELGVAKSGFIFLKDVYKKNKGVVKTNINSLDEVKMALSLINNINNNDVIVNIIGVSGILEKAKDKFMKEE